MTLAPRAVVVHRTTERDEVVARHGTRQAADFSLQTRGRSLVDLDDRHQRTVAALAAVDGAIPLDWRRGRVERADLARFPWGPEDVVVVVGPDGLVANVAKYLDGQPVLGIDPLPGENAGVLVRHRPEDARSLLRSGRWATEDLTMVRATTDDGQTTTALNEIYFGHPAHQSARYEVLTPGGRREQHSSSGILVGTGTGATGWCRSLWLERQSATVLPAPSDPDLVWFAREAWPSPVTGVQVTEGTLGRSGCLDLIARADGLVAFGDGMEADRLTIGWGQLLRISRAPTPLRLVG